jgi:hypothetical protein
MNTEYMRDEKVAPYVIIVAKDGSKFMVVDTDCKVSYNDAVYDRIAETDKGTALAKLALRTQKAGAKSHETKQDAINGVNKIASRIMN